MKTLVVYFSAQGTTNAGSVDAKLVRTVADI